MFATHEDTEVAERLAILRRAVRRYLLVAETRDNDADLLEDEDRRFTREQERQARQAVRVELERE